MANPVLSIGIIFRDDIRSIERCLKALQPLRDTLPCELVLADTGSEDGSRAVAETYADILFDFPWIDDFSAARNAVMDRCSGEWYLSVDTDEYLEDCVELVQFLRSNPKHNLARVVIRNYDSYDMDGSFSDFFTLRLLRQSTGGRYEGIIHESWKGLDKAGPIKQLMKTIFDHDGYVGMSRNAKKMERNISLLREKLRREPKRLLTRLQMIESGYNEPDYVEQIRKGVSMVKRKAEDWQCFGPPLLRHAVIAAQERNLPEFQQWAEMAETWFPESYYTRLDVAVYRQLYDFDRKDYAACAVRGRKLLESYEDFFAGRGDMSGMIYSTIKTASPFQRRNVRMMQANVCTEIGEVEEARAILELACDGAMGTSHTETYLRVLLILHCRSQVPTESLMRGLWDSVQAPEATPQKTQEKQTAFFRAGVKTFTEVYRASEYKLPNFHRHAYTVFLPLRGVSVLGDAAAILSSQDPAEMEALLERVTNWGELPIAALSHALLAGVCFPLAGRQFVLEELDGLALRMAQNPAVLNAVLQKAIEADYTGSWQSLTWTRALALAAVQNFDWKTADPGMNLARTFARVEEAFITGCYAPEVLREGNLCVLPAMHRFGWYCARAFSYLEAGDTLHYVRLLREALTSYEGAKHMADFLLENTPELQAPPESPAPELLELAEKVRALLAQYDPADPAVAVLKASPAYQKVAHLIESA